MHKYNYNILFFSLLNLRTNSKLNSVSLYFMFHVPLNAADQVVSVCQTLLIVSMWSYVSCGRKF